MAVRNSEIGEAPYQNGKANIHSELVTITPDMAKEWLLKNASNRAMRRPPIERYKRSMSRQEWAVTGEAIKFDTDGNLRDGQHRLEAVVESGESIQTFVTYGLSADAFDQMDTGRPRSAGDVVFLHGYGSSRDSDDAASTAKVLMDWELWGELRNSIPPTSIPSNHETRLYVEAHQDELDEALRVTKDIGAAGLRNKTAVWAAVLVRFMRLDNEAMRDFSDKLITGAELALDDPILVLRRRLIQQKTERYQLKKDELAALIIKAWNAYRQHTPLSTLRYTRGGLRPETFPTPV